MKTRSLLIFLSVEKDYACRDSKLSSGPRKLISLKYPSGSNFQSKILELAQTIWSIFSTKFKQDIFDHNLVFYFWILISKGFYKYLL